MPTLTALDATLPPLWPHVLTGALRAARDALGRKVVVLDDDPTGTQSVHDVPVLCAWDKEILARELQTVAPAFYILTNSRSLPALSAAALARNLGTALRRATACTGRAFTLVSRSDSTLRGHYPAETDALAEVVGGVDATVLIPAFFEGGRYTAHDTHYVAEDGELVPAADTPFARDASFGYAQSNLKAWVEEKTAGRIPAGAVASLSLELIRTTGPDGVFEHLLTLAENSVCVVNALHERDLEVATLALMRAEAAGKRYLYRTAASFVPVRAAIPPKPPLGATEFDARRGAGGIVVVGSYVPKTGVQLDYLTRHSDVAPVELKVENLLGAKRGAELERVQAALNTSLAEGDTVLFTSRNLVTGGAAAANLEIGRRVSEALVALVKGLETTPRFLIAKGGITSSDIATRALGVKRALVLGQLLPGVPVWRLGSETSYPGLPYVVFPGNVGGEAALFEAYQKVRG